MIAHTQIRQQIFQKIRKVPSSKLNELNDFLTTLEQTTDKSDKNLSFAGCWNTINDEAFDEFTSNLIQNRSRNSRRRDE